MMWLILLILVLPVYWFLDWLIRSFKITDFENKFIVITGCDSGFGKALALKLDEMRFNVFAGCLTKDGAHFLETHASEKLKTFQLDVSSLDSIQEAFHFVKENLPAEKGIWALVNNAGISGQTGPPDLNIVQDYKTALDINLLGPMEMCRLFLPLVRQSRGRIVNMTSVAGRIAGAEGPYCVTKFGFEGYTDLLRRELYRQGVKVCMLEPGFFKTNILDIDNLCKQVFERMENAEKDVQAAYGKNFARRFTAKMKSTLRIAETNLDPVINAYVHAITSIYPSTRYVIGFFAKFVFVPASNLPDWVLNLTVPIVFNIFR